MNSDEAKLENNPNKVNIDYAASSFYNDENIKPFERSLK